MHDDCAAIRQQKVLLGLLRQWQLLVAPGRHAIKGSELESIASVCVPGEEGDGRDAKKSIQVQDRSRKVETCLALAHTALTH